HRRRVPICPHEHAEHLAPPACEARQVGPAGGGAGDLARRRRDRRRRGGGAPRALLALRSHYGTPAGAPGLGGRPMTVAGAVLRADDGTSSALALGRWLGTPPLEEQRLLSRVESPVLDVGCGPGRHTLALAQRGVVVLGVDVAPSAVAVARERAVAVLERSVFDRLPGERRWATALLLDGNVGIGGSP